MKISSAEVLHLKLRLKSPFETSKGRLTEKDTVVIRLRSSDGLMAYGEAPVFGFPANSYECIDTALPVLERHILPAVLGRALTTVEDLEGCYRPITGHPMAKSAVEAGYWSLVAQAEGVSV